MSVKRISYYLGIFLMIIILSGCMSEKEEIQKIEQDNLEAEMPKLGGELRLPIIQFDTLNPIINTNKSVYYLNMLIYDGLVKLDKDLNAQPALAKSWTSTEDGYVWIFDLRTDVTWHDGKAFSAEDVKFTIDSLKKSIGNENESVYAIYVKHIAGVQVMQSDKIMIRFDNAIDNSIEMFTFPIIPKHQFRDEKDVYETVHLNPIGTGAYRVNKYEKFKNIQLQVNENYWGDKPYISSIIAARVPDKEAALTSVEANEADVAEANHFDWEKYSGDKTLRIYEYITQEYEYLAFNLNRPITGQKNIRKALAYGIDRHEVIDEVYLGHATVTDIPIYPKSYLYKEEENRFGKDVLKATNFLMELGWENKDEDPWVENDKNQELNLRLLVNEENLQRVKVAEMIAEQLGQIGIHIVVDKVGWEEYQRKMFANSFDIVLGGWKLSNIPDLRFFLHSSYIGNTNFASYKSQEMDQLLNEALMAKNVKEKEKKYQQIQQVFLEDLPYFSLYFKNNAIIAKEHIKGEIMPLPFNIYHNIEKWHIEDKEK
ncbi:peptide ABC transporter substrate-binding protein [Clostridiaceae bacterium 35-E11]